MNRLKLVTLGLGILNVLAGFIMATFTILMQNLLALPLGVLYFIFGVFVFANKFKHKMLYFALVPLTTLFSFNIFMLAVDKDIPKHCQMSLPMSLIIIIPLWLLILGNIYGRKMLEQSEARGQAAKLQSNGK